MALDGVLYNVGPHDVIPWHQEMDGFLLGPLVGECAAFELLLLKLEHGVDVFHFHESHGSLQVDKATISQVMLLFKLLECHVVGQETILHLNEFGWVQEFVHVVVGASWRWLGVTTSVAGLRISHGSLSSHLLLEHYLSESLFPQLFVNAQEVSFDHLHCLAIDHELLWNTQSGSHDLFARGVPDDRM